MASVSSTVSTAVEPVAGPRVKRPLWKSLFFQLILAIVAGVMVGW